MRSTRNAFFVVPGLSERFRSGGLMVLRDLAEIFRALARASIFVATHEKHVDAMPLASALLSANDEDIFVVSWGPLVANHIAAIRKERPKARIVYYAQSFGWDLRIPAGIPIVCVSRYVMSMWALHGVGNYVGYAPPVLHPAFTPSDRIRDIDVLVHERKQNEYCLRELVPAIQQSNARVTLVHDWLVQEEFAALLQRTKIFLYTTAPHRDGTQVLPGEGFGLPPLEALACGALVASNLRGGVCDFLTPGENCIKTECGSLAGDVARILEFISSFTNQHEQAIVIANKYSKENATRQWGSLLRTLWTEVL